MVFEGHIKKVFNGTDVSNDIFDTRIDIFVICQLVTRYIWSFKDEFYLSYDRWYSFLPFI